MIWVRNDAHFPSDFVAHQELLPYPHPPVDLLCYTHVYSHFHDSSPGNVTTRYGCEVRWVHRLSHVHLRSDKLRL